MYSALNLLGKMAFVDIYSLSLTFELISFLLKSIILLIHIVQTIKGDGLFNTLIRK